LSAVASWQRAREHCQREVQEIIDDCKSQGKKYTDPDFNPLEDEEKARPRDAKGKMVDSNEQQRHLNT
jgi:hypothetical protein